MILEEAIKADRRRDLPRAADLYEAILASDPRAWPAMLRLLVLYWRVTDYRYRATFRLSDDFGDKAAQRLAQLFEQAGALGNPDLTFWIKYIKWCSLGERFSEEECAALLAQSATLDPALFLFAASQGARCASEAEHLLCENKREGTVKSEYIVSVIDAVMKRATWIPKRRNEVK